MTFEEWWNDKERLLMLMPPDALAHAAWQAAREQSLKELNFAINLLAEWCVAVDESGAGWDYWDEYYKEAMYRPNPIRQHLDHAINSLRGDK